MKSKIYSTDYVKTTSKGQIWIPCFLTVGFLMAFPVAELLMLGNWFGMNYEAAQIESLYENLWRDGFMFTGFVVIAMAALINGINGFWYLYSSRKVDFYHSLPVKRREMFLHRTYVGLLYYLVPYLVMEFLAVCIGAMRGFFSLSLMKMAVAMLVLHLLIYLMLYFCIVLVICMTGNMLMGAVVLSGLLAYGPLLGEMISIYQEAFFSTFYRLDYGIINILKNQGSPLRFVKSFLKDYAQGEPGSMPAVLLILTAAAILGAYFAYMRRPSENVGKSMIYRWSEAVVRFIAVIPIGFGVGLIFYIAPGRSVREYWWVFGMVVGTLLAHGAIEVLYQMDFRKFFSHRLQLVIAGAAVAACALTVKFDLAGYDTYLPAVEKLEEVSVALNGLGGEDVQYIEKEENEDYYEIEASWTNGVSTLDVGISQDIYRSLEHIIDWQGDSEDGLEYFVPVKYKLKSGREVYRNYRLRSNEVRELLKACYDEGALKEQKYAFLKIEEKYLQSLSGTFYDGETYSLFQGEREKMSKFIDAMLQDVKDADSETMLQAPCTVMNFQYENIPVKAETRIKDTRISSTSYYYSMVYVYPGFKRTVALLKETGYPMSMEEVPVKYIRLTCYDENERGQLVDMKEMQYDSQEQISALKKCIMPYQLSCAWTRQMSRADFSMLTENGRDEIPVNMTDEGIPDFVTDFIQQETGGQAGTMQNGSLDYKSYDESEKVF